MKPVKPLLAWLTALLIAAPPALAAQAMGRAPDLNPESNLGGALHGQLALSLADAIAMGLENNLEVEIARHDPLIAAEEVSVAWGAYDPVFDGEVGFRDTDVPNTFLQVVNPTLRQQRETKDGAAGISGLVPYLGAELGLRYGGARDETNSFVESLNPRYTSSLIIDASVPLLRDLIWNTPWTQLQTTKILYHSAGQDFRRTVMDTVAGIEAGYWNLVATAEQERVARKSLETSRALLDQTRTQYEVGVVSRVEVVEATAGVAEREVNLIQAENTHRATEDELILLILGRHFTATARLEIVPTDRPESAVPYEVDLDLSVRKAFRNRPELIAAQDEVDRQELELKFAKNQRLPRLDVVGSYNFSGTRGNTGAPGSLLHGSFKEAASDVFDDGQGRGDDYSVRGVLSIPIGNVKGRHTVSKTQLELRRSLVQLKRLEQDIILEVRNGARDLQSAKRGIDAAERRREAAEEQLRAERIRLEHGESTPFDVLQRERDLVDAESQKIGALRLYRTSAVDLDRAQGTTLSNHQIQIDPVSALR